MSTDTLFDIGGKTAAVTGGGGVLVGAMANYQNENNSSSYYTHTDGATLMERLKTNVFTGYPKTTLYEKEGLSASAYTCDIPLTQDNLLSTWNGGTFGCVTWWAHGSYQSASRKWWRGDNGNNIKNQKDQGPRGSKTPNQVPVNLRYIPRSKTQASTITVITRPRRITGRHQPPERSICAPMRSCSA